jgi:hypothetical protein
MTEQKQVTIPIVNKKLTFTPDGKQPTGELQTGDVWLNADTGLCYTYVAPTRKWVAIGCESELSATPRHEISDAMKNYYERAMNIVAPRPVTATEELEHQQKLDARAAVKPVNKYTSDLELVQTCLSSGIISKSKAADMLGLPTATAPINTDPPTPSYDGQQWLDLSNGKGYTYNAAMNLWIHQHREDQMMVKVPKPDHTHTIQITGGTFSNATLHTGIPKLVAPTMFDEDDEVRVLHNHKGGLITTTVKDPIPQRYNNIVDITPRVCPTKQLVKPGVEVNVVDVREYIPSIDGPLSEFRILTSDSPGGKKIVEDDYDRAMAFLE